VVDNARLLTRVQRRNTVRNLRRLVEELMTRFYRRRELAFKQERLIRSHPPGFNVSDIIIAQARRAESKQRLPVTSALAAFCAWRCFAHFRAGPKHLAGVFILSSPESSG
jgi:hypothetical protein